MHGGMKTYTGSPAAARNYVEADRGRTDDYYLAEGTGVAERYVASPTTRVRRAEPLVGDAYEAWVAGVEPETGVPKGRLRHDDRAVRFVEVTVNGPKSWSLAAELYPDIAGAYEAAQDRAATQVIGWLAQHVTTRIGPRGAQVQVPVEQLEAVTVRHYTSRAGDPHRHLHLQINARVFAAGQWRGLHTVGVRDSLTAINGIGHAAVACDPQFRETLASHGFTLDAGAEITQLAPYVGAFSQRAKQIERNLNRYEAAWSAAHPGEQAGPALRRSWDARAWADGRPDKLTPQPGTDLQHRWLTELTALGYRDPDTLFDIVASPVGVRVGELDREYAVGQVLARLAAGRSGWNAADIRGEVEQLIARADVVTDAAVRVELAEDLTARTLERCVPLLQRDGVPEHIRALTSQHVLDVEADITGRLAVRGAEAGSDIEMSQPSLAAPAGGRHLDVGQRAAVAALAGDRALIVIEGAAGAGKTTTLSTARDLLTEQGRRLLVVTPTLKAAKVAHAEVGAQAGSAAWLAFQHGWRWDQHGTWTRLHLGDADTVTGRQYTGPHERARLRAGDLVVVDEAGMLDQDTARALLTIADQRCARVAFLGDRHQLSAVGRGGVLDLVHRWADPDACHTLDMVHRFTRDITNADGKTVTVADTDYADLSLAMRTGENPGDVFDALLARGQIQLHPSAGDLQDMLADTAAAQFAAGEDLTVVADTREQVNELNAAIRERLAATGHVDDSGATTTSAGQRIGVGDRVATRRNDPTLDVANRDIWTVTRVGDVGELAVTQTHAGDRLLPADYVREHVELAYASTAHGVQGDTVTSAHLVLGEHTGAASAYVGMTRGRQDNTAHLVAGDLEEAREQWVAAFARDRADLGPTRARESAEREAANYAAARPLDDVLIQLRQAWTMQARYLERLEHSVPIRDALREIVSLRRDQSGRLAIAEQRYQHARRNTVDAADRVERSNAVMTGQAQQLREQIQHEWDAQRRGARDAARTVLAGPGRLGLRLPAVNRAVDQLGCWSAAWQPYLPDLPTDTRGIAHYAARADNPSHIGDAFDHYARGQVAHAHPEHADLTEAASAAAEQRNQAWQHLSDTKRVHDSQLGHYGSLAHAENPQQRLDDLDRSITTTQAQLAVAEHAIDYLTADPAVVALPAGQLSRQHDLWRAGYDADRGTERDMAILRASRQTASRPSEPSPLTRYADHHEIHPTADHEQGPSFGR